MARGQKAYQGSQHSQKQAEKTSCLLRCLKNTRPRACRTSTNFRSCLSPGPGLADTSAKATKTDGDNATLSLSLNTAYTLMTTPLVKQFSLCPWLFFCYLREACALILMVRSGTKRGQGPRHGMRFFFTRTLTDIISLNESLFHRLRFPGMQLGREHGAPGMSSCREMKGELQRQERL